MATPIKKKPVKQPLLGSNLHYNPYLKETCQTLFSCSKIATAKIRVWGLGVGGTGLNHFSSEPATLHRWFVGLGFRV